MNNNELCERSVFAKRLTYLRQENGYTQETFAKKVGFSRGRYANYEQGRREPDFEIVKTFSAVLNCSTDYLLGSSTHTYTINIPPRHQESEPAPPQLSADELALIEKYRRMKDNEKDTMHKVADTIAPDDEQAAAAGK